ncbi:(S)-N-methylcoclaurine 3'-hydroxylase isozyme 1-like [Cynara cardunculus var. scolymus]|uniref:(S)-N-methylcoclaurine 3'-hydroxylase isozyme 1-like n=1 Tax=Cynara cardunculus var. scolymus TaxID=59895 RepID=UPI000D626752|nr:(S)-N-methylcoclaurine 3'-hydroxylase isozyme 1-like [Cynara cardunculus var. scolymus]
MSPQLNSYVSCLWQVMMSHKMKDEISLVVVTISLIFVLAILRYSYTLSNRAPPLPPGPRSFPIVGYLPYLRGGQLHTQITDMARTYGPIFKVWLGAKLFVAVNSPELAKEVVRDHGENFANRFTPIAASISTYGGQDVVWSNNTPTWRKLRKLLVHEVLSSKNLEACRSFRKDEVRKTIKNVYSNMGTTINLNEISFSTEANVLTRMVWENSSDTPSGAEFRMVVSKILEIIGRPNVSDYIPSLACFDLQGVERDITREIKKLDQIFTIIIDDRIKSNSKKPDVAIGHHEAGKKDFLQILLELKDQKAGATSVEITNLDIKALLTDIMIGGTDTTTSLIEWTMAVIMQNHNIMARVQEELTQIVGKNNIVEESHISKLKYLDATIKETLRLHPVFSLIPRSSSQTCIIGGYTIPKGCILVLNAWGIHRDPRYWHNPLDFNPERFLDHDGTDKYDFKGNNLKFIPFGSGRRLCPGVPLAEKMQMYILASLLHSFDWSLPEGENHDLSHTFGIMLKKRNPLMAIPSQRLPNVSLYM